MSEEMPFDLSEFLTNSLTVDANSAAQTRPMYPSSWRDRYQRKFEQDPLELLGEKSFGQPKQIPEDVIGTPIQEFYRGVNVLITGGTGFIGKILTEKLIRSVPHIGHVYLLIRAIRGKSSQERFDQLIEDKVFSRMKAEVPDYYTKITAIEGDISCPDLGMSVEDRHLLLDQIQVVFHCAADVRFIEPLRVAIASNVYGSLRIVELCKGMKNLKSYVHVSTAYSQCVQRVIEEKVPKMSISYKEILEYVESSSDEELKKEPLRIMQRWPNTYTFSKAVCEDMIQEEASDLPICIIRPSVVAPTYKEPVRGWTDNVYGPFGIIIATALGIIHCFRFNMDSFVQDNVPVDYTANCMIAAGWRTGTHRENDSIPVYNYTNFTNRECWRSIIKYGYIAGRLWPYSHSIWSLSLYSTASYIVDEVAHIFLHRIPGMLLDTFASMSGQKQRLSKIYEKIHEVKPKLQYFANRTWEFKNENVTEMWSSLTEDDKLEFPFDVRTMNTCEQGIILMLGFRYYYLKESMESIPDAKRKIKWFYWAHCCLKFVSGLVVLKICVCLARILPI